MNDFELFIAKYGLDVSNPEFINEVKKVYEGDPYFEEKFVRIYSNNGNNLGVKPEHIENHVTPEMLERIEKEAQHNGSVVLMRKCDDCGKEIGVLLIAEGDNLNVKSDEGFFFGRFHTDKGTLYEKWVCSVGRFDEIRGFRCKNAGTE